MRFSLAVGLAALASTANAVIVGRQQTPGAAAGSDASPGSSASPSTPASTSSSTTTTTSSGGSDSTVIVTATVTGDAKSTSTTTVGSTRVTTLTDTSTEFFTTTVTSNDNDVATRTIWSTTTVQINKRGIAPATPTPAPAALVNLAKRAVKTSTTTVTVNPSATVVTVTNDAVSTTVTTVTITNTDTETIQANAKSTTTVTSTRTVSALVVTQTLSTSESTSTSKPSNNKGSDGGLTTGAKAGIGAGVGVAALAIIGGLIFFCCRRRSRSPKADPDMMAGASEVPVGAGGGRPMSHASSGAGFRQPPIRTPVKPAPEGYRGTAMGDGRAGYAKPDPYASSYGPSRSTTTTVPPARNSGGADALPEHPVPGSETMLAAVPPHMGSPTVSNVSPAPSKQEMSSPPQNFVHELGTENTAANKWHNESAAEIDSQPVLGHQSGPVYEMPTENYR